MAIIKRNIWSLFYILFIFGTIFLVGASYYKWEDLKQKSFLKQESLVSLVSNATNSLFVAQEMLLDVLGSNLVKNDAYKDVLQTSKLLDEMLLLNPSIAAFGLVTPKGKIVTVGSNINVSNLPNLLELKSSRDSFLYTLKTDKMVLGRTYFFEPLQYLIIPIRKSIRDKNGKVIAVMTAGIRAHGSNMFFGEKITFGGDIVFNLIRTRDHYLQLILPETMDNIAYNKQIPQQIIETVYVDLAKKYNKPKEFIKNSQELFSVDIQNSRGMQTQAVIKQNNRYELLVVSQIEIEKIRQEFYKALAIYFGIFSLVYIVLYLLFRYVANFEKQRREHLVYQATHDALTNLPNRVYLNQNFSRYINEIKKPFSILFIDMDKFKNVNDTFGHQVGDKVLIELSRRIKLLISESSIVIRHGGDEFIVLTYKVNDDELQKLSFSIVDSLSTPYLIDNHTFILGASIGIAKYPEHGDTLDMLLRASDIAMYEAKKYKNCVYFFVESMQELYIEKLEIEQELRQALDKEEFSLVYQPQCYEDDSLYGVEALLRWNNKKLGFIPPDKFISIAESIGIMPKIGSFVIQRALSEISDIKKEVLREFELSINISVKQFVDKDFLSNLLTIVKEENFSKDHLTLEITENIFIEEIEYILNLLQDIKEEGIKISLDDFGTGYSSLSLLKNLPIDEIKIDKSFVDEILNDINSLNMVKSIITIGENLDIKMVAEGTETKEQVDKIKSLGCDIFQGYYYSKPLCKDKLIKFINK